MESDPTCWTLIHDAAQGDAGARADFARHYEGVLRAYFGARWRGPRGVAVDDAVQDVFVECFKERGALQAANPDLGSFHAFLYGIARRVALRHEERGARRRGGHEVTLPTGFEACADDEALSRVFDRAWAEALLREAAERMRARGLGLGGDAARRVELLDLRFREGLPVRAIAERWGEPREQVHRSYARAREEFRAALIEVVAFHQGSPREAAAQAEKLLELLV